VRKIILKAMTMTIVGTMICTVTKMTMKDTIRSRKMSIMLRTNNHSVLKSLIMKMSKMIMHLKIKTTSTM